MSLVCRARWWVGCQQSSSLATRCRLPGPTHAQACPVEAQGLWRSDSWQVLRQLPRTAEGLLMLVMLGKCGYNSQALPKRMAPDAGDARQERHQLPGAAET